MAKYLPCGCAVEFDGHEARFVETCEDCARALGRERENANVRAKLSLEDRVAALERAVWK